MSTQKEAQIRIIRSVHILLYVILIGLCVFTYIQTRQTYDTASLDNSYIECSGSTPSQKPLDGLKLSLHRLNVKDTYSATSAALNGFGQQIGDDQLADKACDTEYGQLPPTCITALQGSFEAFTCNYHGPTSSYIVHFVHNDTLNPVMAVFLATGIGIVTIELLALLLVYSTTGRKSFWI